MNDRIFLDTNVVVYAFDDANPEKQRRAWEVMETAMRVGGVALSTQVLQEFYVTVVRKLERPLPADVATRAVVQLARLPVYQVDTDTVLAAVTVSRTCQLSFWDALILQAAVESGCTRLLSEDLQDGFRYGNLRIENPFTKSTALAEP